MKTTNILRILIFSFYFPCLIHAIQLRPGLAKIAARDTTCKVWVIFTDKNNTFGKTSVSPRALARRIKSGAFTTNEDDAPITDQYIKEIESSGCRCMNLFKWSNAASFSLHSSFLPILARKRYVKDILPVRNYARSPLPVNYRALKKYFAFDSATTYGKSIAAFSLVAIPTAHSFINATKKRPPGDSTLIAFFDSGFRLNHACFDYLKIHHAVIADSDFVDRDTSVSQPDSSAQLSIDPYDNHGSWTFALVSGYDPPFFTGIAWGAHFVLARTEDNKTELHIEEDNWAAAVVWAESLGVDIVSSSLGYRYDFDAPDEDYTYQDMDGQTTIVSKAAREAVRRGMIIVNAMGNEGNGKGSLIAPADVKDVISVGAINYDLTIASFSSRGPASDGRTKPDCVAPGVSIPIPDVYSKQFHSYITESGTSFATPIVAGICGLIIQTHASDSAAEIRKQLYSSCIHTPWQDSTDNTFGRGIPDALIGCLDYSKSYIHITDPTGNPLFGAEVRRNNSLIGLSDSQGIAVFTNGNSFPDTLMVLYSNQTPEPIFMDAPHKRGTVNYFHSLYLSMKDPLGQAVTGTIFFKPAIEKRFVSLKTDAAGKAWLANLSTQTIILYGKADGFFNSAPETLTMISGLNAHTVTLRTRPASQFALYPTLLDMMHKKQRLTMEFFASPDDAVGSQLLTVTIRTAAGNLVWQSSTYCEENMPIVLKWPQPNQSFAPGMYYFIAVYGGKTHTKKFIITG